MKINYMNNNLDLNYTKNTECLACLNKNIRVLLDLGRQPLANSFHEGKEVLDQFPLTLNICPECFHLQQGYTVNPDLIFKNYLYVSGTTKTLHEYFDFFAKKTITYKKNAVTVLDIACNDATQLDYFKKNGLKTYGIDPAKNIFEISKNKNHSIICDYFTKQSVSKFNTLFDIIIAQNVFAHTKNVVEFLQNCKMIMHDESVLFIQTSQADMVLNNEFDTIYHEHISFFNSRSMDILVNRCGLYLNDIFKTDIHGTSYVFVITKKGHLEENNVKDEIKSEANLGLYNMKTYGSYVSKCYDAVFNLKEKLDKFREQGYLLIGYGAAAKGNTLLNFGNIKLDIIIDDNELKCGLLTPGQNIPIHSPKYLQSIKEDKKIIFIPLAWNFYKEITNRIKNKRNNKKDIFIKYFPHYEEINCS